LPLFRYLLAKKILRTCVLDHTTAVAAGRLLLLPRLIDLVTPNP